MVKKEIQDLYFWLEVYNSLNTYIRQVEVEGTMLTVEEINQAKQIMRKYIADFIKKIK